MSPTVIPVVALMVPMVIVPTSLWFRHRLKVRELEHAERIRAMQLGIVPRQPQLSWPGATVCIAIGGGVPVGSMLIAWLAMLTNDLPTEVFGVPLLISCGAIWAAKSLADRMMGVPDEAQVAAGRPRPTPAGGKPAFDPDAYDVVGSRG